MRKKNEIKTARNEYVRIRTGKEYSTDKCKYVPASFYRFINDKCKV